MGIHGWRVLAVEDEFMIAMMLEDMLVELGCDVAGIAANPKQALELIESKDIDAAVLDVNLDGANSLGIAAVLREKQIPFIFATGYGSTRLPPEFASCGTIQKPYRLEDLAGALGQLRVVRKG